MEPERRASHPIELRSKGRKLEGFAALFNVEMRIGDFIEVVKPGAFSASLSSGQDILALRDHDPTRVLGRTRSGTLKLNEDARGLHFEIDLPDTSEARDLLALVERQDIGGASFAFDAIDESWQGNRRELKQVKLYEISIVSAFPAYPTSVNARAKQKPPSLWARLNALYIGALG